MSRATNNVAARARHHKVLKRAKGYRGGKSRLYKTAKEAVERSLLYAFRDRRVRPFTGNNANQLVGFTDRDIKIGD